MIGAPKEIGPYEVIDVLGQGGVGDVYLARQRSMERSVALKLVRPGLLFEPGTRARFRREAAAAARLAHPNIVQVHAFGEEEGTWFIAQELVGEGRTLADEIDLHRREAELSKDYYRSTARFFAEVAGALQAAHEAGVHNKLQVVIGGALDARFPPLQLEVTVEQLGDGEYPLESSGTPENADRQRELLDRLIALQEDLGDDVELSGLMP